MNGVCSPCAWGNSDACAMAVLKKLAFLVGITVAAICVALWTLRSFGFRSPITALLINWLVVCCIATASLVVHFPFPASYHETRHFEGKGRIYERIGVRFCKTLLRRGPLRILSPKLRMPNPITAFGLRNLENEMRNAETIHALALVLMLFVVGYAAVKHSLVSAMCILMFNMLFNGYPMMLQRYNRIRLQKLIGRHFTLLANAAGSAHPVADK